MRETGAAGKSGFLGIMYGKKYNMQKKNGTFLTRWENFGYFCSKVAVLCFRFWLILKLDIVKTD